MQNCVRGWFYDISVNFLQCLVCVYLFYIYMERIYNLSPSFYFPKIFKYMSFTTPIDCAAMENKTNFIFTVKKHKILIVTVWYYKLFEIFMRWLWYNTTVWMTCIIHSGEVMRLCAIIFHISHYQCITCLDSGLCLDPTFHIIAWP